MLLCYRLVMGPKNRKVKAPPAAAPDARVKKEGEVVAEVEKTGAW